GEDPDNREARLGLGRILAERGDLDQAQELVTPLLPDFEAERILAIVTVAGWAEPDPVDPLVGPKRMAAEGRWRGAVDAFLGVVRFAPDDRDAARDAMVKVFAVLGDDDPLTREYRGKLASA